MDATAPATKKLVKYQPGNVPFVDFEPCSSTAKHTGEQCLRRPIPGGPVCVKHGGGARQVQAKAQRTLHTRKIKADASKALAREGVVAIGDPLDELGKLASSAQALMHTLGAHVNALDEIDHFDTRNVNQVRAVVELYERSMDRTHRLLDSLVKHGYTEREVRLAENQALLVGGVIRRVIQQLGLTEAQTRQAGEALALEFRQLEKQGLL